MTFTPSVLSQNGTPNGKVVKDNTNQTNGHATPISNKFPNRDDSRPVSVHGNLINNQSIYANTMMVPKMNGTPVNGAISSFRSDSKHSSGNTETNSTSMEPSNLTTANLNTSTNALLNTSKISSSNSPSTNGTKTTVMDSSRENPHEDFESSTRVSPPTTTNGCNVSLSRSSSHRHGIMETQTSNYQSPSINSHQNRLNLAAPFHNQLQSHKAQTTPRVINTPQINSLHSQLNTTRPQGFNTSDILSPGTGERSFNLPHNSTLAPNANLCSSQNNRSHNQSRSASNSFFNTSFIPTRNANNNQRVANMTSRQNSIGPMSGYGAKLKNSSLIPENVSKFMQMSKEVGIKDAITSLGLLCLVSLLLALLSLVFLLKLSPVTEERRRELYRFNFLSAKEYVLVYEVTLGMCALALSLNLCCLLVSSIQFFLAVKLVKSSPIHGRAR